jgi:L-ascorbate metabolism protein UlaG (beta-lactamase superfamily)
MSVTIQWFGHAGFKISHNGVIIYIDPWKLGISPHDATFVLVSHMHYDHYSNSDIIGVSGPRTQLIATADVIEKEGAGQVIEPGRTIEIGQVRVTATPAYTPDKQYHPRANNWVGFIVEIGSKRIYYAGDTDIIPEMRELTDIDLALLPVGGTYTMDADEAARAVSQIKPQQAIPYHWGDIVGSLDDAEKFTQTAACKVALLNPGESVTL